MARRCKRACLARTSWCFATARAASAYSMRRARIGARRWCSAAMKKAACAACITAGRWTSMATCWRCHQNPRPAAWRKRSSTERFRPRNGAASSGRGSDRKMRCRTSRRPRGRPTPTCGSASRKRCCHATGRRSWKARSIRPTARPCIPRTWCRLAWTARKPPTRPGCGHRPTRRRGFRCSAAVMAFATRHCAGPSPTQRRTNTCARRCSSHQPRP
jgi:hypothetical protein